MGCILDDDDGIPDKCDRDDDNDGSRDNRDRDDGALHCPDDGEDSEEDD